MRTSCSSVFSSCSISRLGTARIERRPTDISAIAREIVDELVHDDPDRRVDVRIIPGMSAQAEPRLVRALLVQLLSNAWKFTSPSPSAAVEVGREAGGAFYVRDNGVGFDMEFAGRMFDTFQRLHAADEFPGEGVGLALAHRVVRRHGGWIRASGARGKGATFRFTLEPTVAAVREDEPDQHVA